jgi:hypothetical protein
MQPRWPNAPLCYPDGLPGTRKDHTDELFPVVYQELHRLARRYLRIEHGQRHSISPTVLLNEGSDLLTRVKSI